MLLPRPLIVPFSPIDVDNATKWARLAERGGQSVVREAAYERDATLSDDQLVGQLAGMAGSLLLTGNLDAYRLARAYALEQGGGTHASPVRGSKISFKGSFIRGRQALWKYNLAVAPTDTQLDWEYFLVLVPDLRKCLISGCAAFALIMGYAPLVQFSTIARGGTFKGKYTLPVTQLQACTARNGVCYADEELIAKLEEALAIAPGERWAAVT